MHLHFLCQSCTIYIMNNKICRICAVDKPLSAFRQRLTGTYRHECKDCQRQICRDNYWKDPKKAQALNNRPEVKAKAAVKRKQKQVETPHLAQEQFFKTRYGINFQTYHQLLVQQNQVCAICQQPEIRKRNGKTMALAVDHCHSTGKVRGLLCNSCNTGIGLLRDNPLNLTQAAYYLIMSR